MVAMTFQKKKDMDLNIVSVLIQTEQGCDAKDGEYTMTIDGIIGQLDIYCGSGFGDADMVRDCIVNDLDFNMLPVDGVTRVVVIESGEWEDMHWNKYYEILRTVVIHDNTITSPEKTTPHV